MSKQVWTCSNDCGHETQEAAEACERDSEERRRQFKVEGNARQLAPEMLKLLRELHESIRTRLDDDDSTMFEQWNEVGALLKRIDGGEG